MEFDWNTFIEEEEKVEQLKDEKEKKVRLELLYKTMDEVSYSIYKYNRHLSQYDYRQKWKEIYSRGVVCILQDNAASIKANWSKIFTQQVTKAEKKEIRYDQFRWHVFSFEKIKALEKEKAREAFDQCKKSNVYVFYQLKDQAFLLKHAKHLKSEDFDSDSDVYVFDPEQKWTYVRTHEEQCGPYFYQVP